jgi:hypothetical protein
VRRFSHLPGLEIPAHEGRWVSRDGSSAISSSTPSITA